jgi:type I protein arginine methyltransferase
MYFYDLAGYGKMIMDRIRTSAYQRALARAIRPGDVVVDLGAGTGLFTLHACRLGAKLVHAIEPNPIIQVAREIVQANGFSDRVAFHQAMSFDVQLSQPANVVVTDPRGVLPLNERAIPTIIDARRHLLEPGGVLIPQRDTIWASLVEANEIYRAHCEDPWRRSNDGFNLEAARQRRVNISGRHHLKRSQLLSVPVHWNTLDYRTIETASVDGTVEFEALRPGLADGFILWFDSELIDGIKLSNAPGKPKLIYGQLFFPMQEPLPVLPKQLITVDVRADLIGDDYVWQWTTLTNCPTASDKIIRYHQSSFFNNVCPIQELEKRSDTYVPLLNREGQIYRRALDLMHSGQRLGQIAQTISKEFPQRFGTADEALAFLGDLSVRLCA